MYEYRRIPGDLPRTAPVEVQKWQQRAWGALLAAVGTYSMLIAATTAPHVTPGGRGQRRSISYSRSSMYSNSINQARVARAVQFRFLVVDSVHDVA